jgi:hypothetical protein
MAAFDPANSFDVTDATEFIPEVWSNETVAAYKANLVLANLVTKLNHMGKIGDTINIPRPVRGSAQAKTPSDAVSLIPEGSNQNIVVTINQHFHYARMFDDIAEIQALASMRRFYTDDAGYALAVQVDTALGNLAATWGTGTKFTSGVIGSDGSTNFAHTTTGNGASISDAGLRRVVQTFDDNDVPARNRYLVIPPVEKRKLLGESRFTEQAFVGEGGSANSIRNGFVGNLYGVEIFVSSNLPTQDSNDCTTYTAALMFQKEALVLAEQLAPRVQSQYKLEGLGTLIVADQIFGVQTLRGASATAPDADGAGTKAIMVPST